MNSVINTVFRPLLTKVNTMGPSSALGALTQSWRSRGRKAYVGPRDNWPMAKEHKRIAKFGWNKRILSLNGRLLILKNIHRGKFILSH